MGDSNKVDGGGKRLNAGKMRLDLVPNSAIYAIAKVMEYGAQKYDDHNWRRGMKWTTVIACLKRHIAKFEDGEDLDVESREHHMAHVLCNAAMLIEYYVTCKELDDRYKGAKATYKDFENKE